MWFKGIQWISKKMHLGRSYVIYGKPQRQKDKLTFAHPEMDEIPEGRSFSGKDFNRSTRAQRSSREKVCRAAESPNCAVN